MFLKIAPSVRFGQGHDLAILFREGGWITFLLKINVTCRDWLASYLLEGIRASIDPDARTVESVDPDDQNGWIRETIIFSRPIKGYLDNADAFLFATKRLMARQIKSAERKALIFEAKPPMTDEEYHAVMGRIGRKA